MKGVLPGFAALAVIAGAELLGGSAASPDARLPAPDGAGPAAALGASEAPLLEMTGVYATLASAGRRAEPWGVRRVRLRGDDAALMHHAEDRPQAVSPRTARRLLDAVLPARFRPHDVRGRRVAGVAFDEFDVEYVVVYEAVPAPTA